MTEPIIIKGALHFGVGHEIGGGFVHFLGRNSGTNQFSQTIEDVARGAARLPHLLDFLGVLDRNTHAAATLSSISRDISANTVSRSQLPSIRRKIDILL